MDKTAITLKSIDKHLRDNFKSVCAKEGVTMKEALIEYMQKVVESGKLKS